MSGYPIPATPPALPVTSLGATPYSVLYSNSAGEVVELPVGAADEVLTSQGPSSNPVWALPGELAATDVGLVLALS